MKHMQVPVVYKSNYVAVVHNNHLLRKMHECASPNTLAMLKALSYFEGRSLILVPNVRQGSSVFWCVVRVVQCI